jgi:hypothetical protein
VQPAADDYEQEGKQARAQSILLRLVHGSPPQQFGHHATTVELCSDNAQLAMVSTRIEVDVSFRSPALFGACGVTAAPPRSPSETGVVEDGSLK